MQRRVTFSGEYAQQQSTPCAPCYGAPDGPDAAPARASHAQLGGRDRRPMLAPERNCCELPARAAGLVVRSPPACRPAGFQPPPQGWRLMAGGSWLVACGSWIAAGAGSTPCSAPSPAEAVLHWRLLTAGGSKFLQHAATRALTGAPRVQGPPACPAGRLAPAGWLLAAGGWRLAARIPPTHCHARAGDWRFRSSSTTPGAQTSFPGSGCSSTPPRGLTLGSSSMRAPR